MFRDKWLQRSCLTYCHCAFHLSARLLYTTDAEIASIETSAFRGYSCSGYIRSLVPQKPMHRSTGYLDTHPLYSPYYAKPTPYNHQRHHNIVGVPTVESDETIRQPLLLSREKQAQSVEKENSTTHQVAQKGPSTSNMTEGIVERRTSYGRGGAGNLRK